MMLLLCPSEGPQVALTSAVYFIAVISTCSTKKCGFQLIERMKSTSVVFRNIDMNLCRTECIEDTFAFASCRRTSKTSKKAEKKSRSITHSENHHNVSSVSCGFKVCNETSECVNKGCQKACMEAPPLCALHIASKNGNLSRVTFLLSQEQVDVNCQEWIGRTPVMWAAAGGHKEVFELLVSKGAKLSLVDRFGINILHAVCLGGDVELVKYVLSQNILDINSRAHCMSTAIMLAAEDRHKDVIELLVVKGADISLVDKTGKNILHYACKGGGMDEVKYILSQNMVDSNSREHYNKTPVMVAAAQGHKGVVELLIKHGADLSVTTATGNILHLSCNHGQFDIVKYLLSQSSVDINSRGWKKRTPAIVAAVHGHREVVELLVKHGADVSLTARSGYNVLHVACSKGQFDIVKYLLSLTSVDINSRGCKKRTPLMEAAGHGHREVVELLVKHGADLSLTATPGYNVLHVACSKGQFDIVKYLLSLTSVDINSRGWKKRTPAMVAAGHGHKEVVELLVNHGADMSLTSSSENNVLHVACSGGQFDVVKYLLSLDSVDINSRGKKKMTPAMVAAEMGYEEVVKLLLKNGAGLHFTDKDANTL